MIIQQQKKVLNFILLMSFLCMLTFAMKKSEDTISYQKYYREANSYYLEISQTNKEKDYLWACYNILAFLHK